MNIVNVIALVWMHFFADFILQTDAMALNKSSSNKWLLFHVAVYSAPFLLWGWRFALVNMVAHFVTDWVTSRIASNFYKNNERHWFFVVIGFDQAVHLTCLFVSFSFIVRGI